MGDVAWERRGSGVYFYRSVRDAGRVRKEYVGTGRIAELAAELGELDRLERKVERFEAEEQLAMALEACPPDELLSAFSQQVDRMIADALTTAGFHRHKRGEWR